MPAPPPPPTEPTPAARTLLDIAERQLREHQLATPPGANALESYARALALDPSDVTKAEVMRGRERVIEAYLGLAERAFAESSTSYQSKARARSYINQAAAIDPAHPGIAPMRARLAQLGSAARQRVVLNPAALRARDASVTAQLLKIGTDAKQRHAMVSIAARNDDEGRWIYHQLAQAPGEGRIRAEIKRSATPGVQLIYLEAPCAHC